MAAVTTASTPTLITLDNGWQAWLMPDGRVRPHIRGAEDPPAPTPPTPQPQPTPAPTPPNPQPTPAPTPDPNAPDLTALQGALNAAKVSGSTEALQPLMQAVGVATPEALQEWITAAHAAQQAQLSETQRREQELAQREAAAATAAAAAATETRNSRVLSQLLLDGAPAANARDLIPLVTLPAGDITDEQLVAAVTATKEKFPALFTPGAPAPTPPAPSSRAPGAPQPTPTPANDPLAAGRERAKKMAARHQGATKDDLINDFTPGRSPLLPAS